jgi:hypothetical protein
MILDMIIMILIMYLIKTTNMMIYLIWKSIKVNSRILINLKNKVIRIILRI